MKQRYENRAWDNYAHAHLTVLTSYQLEVYNEVAALAHGHVIDLGCGSARATPFLADNPAVSSYIGVDSSPEMIKAGRWLVDLLKRKDFVLQHQLIEETKNNSYDFGFAVHSYYSWPKPEPVIAHIHDIIKPGGDFILVTPNPTLDMIDLARQTDKELLSHPGYPYFRSQNIELAENGQALFTEMDTLVKQCTEVGFKLQRCHQRYYSGGANFLHLTK